MMSRYLLIVLLAISLAAPGVAQEQGSTAEADASAVAGETQPGTGDGEDGEEGDDAVAESSDQLDDSDLDEQVYEEDEDDFIPSEEIPADEAIPFPSDI